MLEAQFTGYESISDVPKSTEKQTFEALSKLTDPFVNTAESFTGEIQAQPSLFDGVFVVDTDKEECHRRAKGRKVDPTTGMVYHAEDSPVPEGDAKLIERLTDFYGNFANEEDMSSKIDLNHLQYTDSEGPVRLFYDSFGKFDKATGKGIKSGFVINVAANQKKEDTFAPIEKQIDGILNFKRIATDREY